jgi:murein DD-endopeptidase MepM/ murein hydrolase activator NlpD
MFALNLRRLPLSLIFALAAALTVLPARHAASQVPAEAPRAPIIEVVAFGVAPVAGIPENANLQPRSGDIVHRVDALGTRAAADGETEGRTIAGERWPDLFRRLGSGLGNGLLASPGVAEQLHLLPELQAGKYVRLRALPEREAVQIDYVVRPEEVYSILVSAGGVQVEPNASDPRVVERMRADPSKASLFTATDAIGLPEDIALQLADIFADNVDFHRELHRGYRASLVYEVLFKDGHIDRPGRILAAEFTIHNQRLQAFYFDAGGVHRGYFNENGASLKKVFRRSPVEFSRVTSEYTLARFHPILGLWRAHRGIDYAAPMGTRVVATAAGAIEHMGLRGEYGNLLILNHSDRYLTYYGHLDGFAPGLAVGRPVEKGQVIGYVGMTGLATGPHLHYEFHVRNGAGQWQSVPPPDLIEIPPLTTPEYFQAVLTYQNQLQVAQSAHFVILD